MIIFMFYLSLIIHPKKTDEQTKKMYPHFMEKQIV
jgi:hypothetical protein